RSNYDTDLFLPLIAGISDLTGKPYTGEHQVAMRVIADHVRALTFAITEGGLPSNEGSGYVLRRILRRAARYGRTLGVHEPFIHGLVPDLVRVMGDAFPEIAEQAEHVAMVIKSEEEGFGRTLDRGLEIFEEVSQKGNISGPDAFRLYDTYGFPLDLTQLMASEKGLEVDVDGFGEEMSRQQARSRDATRGVYVVETGVGEGVLPEHHSEFVGYESLEVESVVVGVQRSEDGALDLFLDRTPFYSEAGGQIGDRGVLTGDGVEFQVENTYGLGEAVAHRCRLTQGDEGALHGLHVRARVDVDRRLHAARNHTATHLMHEALRRVLGRHVQQAGSLVEPDRLRFDFTHFAGVTAEQLAEIETLVNDVVRQDLRVDVTLTDMEAAKQAGAAMLFTEKYGDVVRMVRVGDYSAELCGGTHLASTGQVGSFELVTESGIAAGVRRIEALTGAGVEQASRKRRSTLAELESLLGAGEAELAGRVSGLLARVRELERELLASRRESAGSSMAQLVRDAVEVDGVRVVAEEVESPDVETLRDLGDGLRNSLGTGVGVLGADLDGKASLIAVVTDDLISRGVQAGTVVKEVARLVGGGGGGKPHMAQAGGKNPEKMKEALAEVPGIVRAQLGG
ncbi:MAG: alanine--tRNA ligase, partial [Candidatus Latescibacteria bacterium]|nr:alanine--tRNA ligase [Candidatus Latescibacterota bacterium]